MLSWTATRQTCGRDILTKDILVLSWILEHHFLHFPANDSISTSLASHSAQLSFFKHVPLCPTETGCLGVSKSYHEICLYVQGCVPKNTQYKHTQTAWWMKRSGRKRIKWLILPREGDGRQLRRTQGSIEDSLFLPKSSPFFLLPLLPSQLQQGPATPQF